MRARRRLRLGQRASDGRLHGLDRRVVDHARLDEAPTIELGDRGMLADLLVERGMREGRVVQLVVAVPAVAAEVDEDVAPERLPEADGEPGGLDDRLGVVAVDVEDRDLNVLRHVGGIPRGPEVLRRRGEAELVVDDDVDRPARREAGQGGQDERLVDRSLPRERGVAVQEHRDDALALDIVPIALLGSDDALDDGVHHLQVARIGGERQVDRPAAPGDVVVRVAEVVLHVPVALDVRRQEGAFELRQHHLVRLLQHVRQDVQSAAMGHAEDELVGLERRGLLHERVEQRNEGLAAFERESLLAHVLGVEELFERLGPDEPPKDVGALVVGHGRPVARRLHPLLEPRPRGFVGDVHVLDAERAAVRFLEGGHELAQRGPLETLEGRGVHRAAEVSLREAELSEGE